MWDAVYNSTIPDVASNPAHGAVRFPASLRILLHVLLMAAPLVTLSAAADWNTPEQNLARKIVASAGSGRVAVTFANRSSLGKRDADIIENGLRGALQSVGMRFAAAADQASANVTITLSENPASYIWIAEIRPSTGEPVVVLVSTPRPEGLAGRSLSCGVSWLGMPIPRRIKTYFVSREDAPGITQRRIGRLLRGSSAYTSLEGWMRINTRRHTADFKVTNEEHMNALIREIKEFGCEFCVLDVFRSVHEAEENDNDEMPVVLSKVNRIQNECNCAVAIVHHLSKSVPENIFRGLRGASAIHGWMEWGIGISVTNPEEEDKTNFVRKLEFENKEGVALPVYSMISGKDPEVIRIVRVESPVKEKTDKPKVVSGGATSRPTHQYWQDRD